MAGIRRASLLNAVRGHFTLCVMPPIYPLRSITFSVDLLFRPLTHDAKKLQRIHNLLFADAIASYVNFAAIPGGAQLSNPQGAMTQATSTALFLPDRVRVQEHHTGISNEDFRTKVERIAEHSLRHLEIPAFVAQQVVVQSLVNPRHATDSREFMARAIWRMNQDDFAPLGRSPQLLGLRLAFPQTPDDPGLFNVRIESYGLDPRALFLENVGVFGTAITLDTMNTVASNMESTYGFLQERVLPFLARFDSASS